MGTFTKRGFSVLALLLACSGQAYAAAHMTLPEVVQKVVLTNPEVLAKWHAFNSAASEVDVAKAGFLPKIDFSYNIGTENLIQPGVATRNFGRDGHTFALSQMLFDGYATINDVRRLDKARLTRYFELIDAAENAALEAGRAYFDVMRYRYLVLLAEASYVEHRASYEQLLRRAQSGAGRRVDVEHASSRLALSELNLHTEAANLHDVMSRFIRLVGISPPVVMFAPPSLSREFPSSEADALRQGFRRNASVRAAIENLESVRHDAELRRASLFPRLDLRMRNEATENYQGTPGNRRNNVAELVFSYNLFNGGADTARQSVYAERKYQAMDLREKACRDVRQTLSIAFNDVDRLKSQLSNLDQQVSSIEKTRDAYKAQFNIGQRSLLDLLDTENELLNARRTAVNADIDLGIAYLRTQAGLGRLMEFLGVRPQGLDSAIDNEFNETTELCPPHTPGGYLVNLDVLKARAMASLEAIKPPQPPASTPKLPPPPTSGGATLSGALQTPEPDKPSKVNSGAFRKPPPLLADAGKDGKTADRRGTRGSEPSVGGVLEGSPVGSVPKTGAQDVQRTDALLASEEEVRQQVAAWASAWSSGNFDRYAAFYSPDFVPDAGLSQAAWAKLRRSRIAGRDGIRIDVSKIIATRADPNKLVTEFVQQYRSKSFNATTRKILHWVRVGASWLIERETVPRSPVPTGRSNSGVK